MKKMAKLEAMIIEQNKDRNSDNFPVFITSKIEKIGNHASMITRWAIAAVNYSKIKNINGK
jgi:hypothetical protein